MSSSSNRLTPAHLPAHPPAHPPAHLPARALIIAIATGAAISLGATAHADIDLNSAATSLNISAVGLNAAAVGIAEKDKPTRLKPQPASSLRCWQYGRLLFEEINIEPSPQSLDKSLVWKQGDHPTPSLHLLQLHDTVCLFKASDGGVRSQ